MRRVGANLCQNGLERLKERPVTLVPHEAGCFADSLHRPRQGMCLRIGHHLQAVLGAAKLEIERGQPVALRLADPLLGCQRRQRRKRAAIAKRFNTAATDQLQHMGQEFDAADAVRPGLQVEAFPARRTRRPSQHDFHVVHHRVIEGPSPDKGLDIGQKLFAHGNVARDRTGADEGGTLPRPGNRFIIAERRLALDADSSCPGIGPEPQIDPPADAVARRGGEQAHKVTGHADIGGLAGLGISQRIVDRVVKQDQVNVRGIVQLAGTKFAKRQHNPSAPRHAGRRDHRLVGDLAAPRCPPEKIGHGGTKRAFCRSTQPAHLFVHRRDPGHVGKGDGQRALLAKPPDRLDHRCLFRDLGRRRLEFCHGRGNHIANPAGQDVRDAVRMGARQSLKVAGMGENRGKLGTIQLAAVRHMGGCPFCQFRQDTGMRIQRTRRAGNKPVGR